MIDENAFISSTTDEKLEILKECIDGAYPKGHVCLNTDVDFAPAKWFGGTWLPLGMVSEGIYGWEKM